jgi:hypothetical protein
MNQKSGLVHYTKVILSRIVLSAIGIILALVVIEVGLRLIPLTYLDDIIERSSQRLQLYRLDPRIGWTLNPKAESVITTRSERTIPISVNSLGLRDTEHTYEKPPGVFRGLMLGDSFTEALDVYLEESYPYRVEKCLNQHLTQQIEIINGGVSGYNTADEYLFYKHEGVKYNPDLVLLLLYIGNDFAGLNRDIDNDRLVAGFGGYRFFLKDGQLKHVWLSWENPEDGTTSPVVLFLRNHSRLYRILAHPESKIYDWYKNQVARWWPQPRSDSEDDDDEETLSLDWYYYIHYDDFANNPTTPAKLRKVWAVFQAIISQLNSEVTGRGGQLAIIIIPADYQVSQTPRNRLLGRYSVFNDESLMEYWRLNEPNVTIIREMERQGIPVLDLMPYFQSHYEAGGAALYFDGFADEHLNQHGQKLAGDIICDWLIQNQSVRLPIEGVKR